MAGISYLDFDLRIEASGTGYRALVQSSPAGQASTEFVKPFSDDELEIFLLRVGRPRQGLRRLNSPEGQLAEKYGARLFEAVFGDEVYGCFRSSLTTAQKQDKGLRVRLRVDVPELNNLPWEYLYNPRLDRFLSLAVETPIVRYLELTEPIRALTVRPPLKVLAMISSPSDYPSLDVKEEWARLSSALAPLTRRGQVTLECLETATLAALQRRLRRGECHIFHFIGHGQFDEREQDGVLLLESENNRGRPLSGQYVGTLLHNHRPLRLVILNACEGARTSRTDPFAGVAQSLVQQGIPAVIAMQFEITNKAAIAFAQTFYEALADGYPVDAALAEARMAIFAQENDIEWGTPVLFTRTLDGRIFDMAQVQAARPSISKASPEIDAGLGKRLEQLYTDGLSAFYTDEWEKACRSFQAIVDVRPNYRQAAALLEDAERQRKLSTLYAQAQAALEVESWKEALPPLEELAVEAKDYRDVASLLEKARKQARLAELYTQARQLYQAQQWQAVTNLFDRIHTIDADYPDPESLMSTAQQGLEELKRQAELSDLYSRAVGKMGDGKWQEAHQLLIRVQGIEPNYKQVERLLTRAEAELGREKAERQRQDQLEERVKPGFRDVEQLLVQVDAEITRESTRSRAEQGAVVDKRPEQPPRGKRSLLWGRIGGVFIFRQAVYTDVAGDTGFTLTACILIVMIAVSSLVTYFLTGYWGRALVSASTFLIGFLVDAALSRLVSKTAFKADVKFGGMIRILALAYEWYILQLIPIVGIVAEVPVLVSKWIALKAVLNLNWWQVTVIVILGSSAAWVPGVIAYLALGLSL